MDTGRYGFDVTPCMNKRCKDEIVSGLCRRLYSQQQKAFSPGGTVPEHYLFITEKLIYGNGF